MIVEGPAKMVLFRQDKLFGDRNFCGAPKTRRLFFEGEGLTRSAYCCRSLLSLPSANKTAGKIQGPGRSAIAWPSNIRSRRVEDVSQYICVVFTVPAECDETRSSRTCPRN